jgi:hypothetical protein
VSLFVWLLSPDLSGMGVPTSSYATAGIALRVSGALKPHHHDKVETPSVGDVCVILPNFFVFYATTMNVPPPPLIRKCVQYLATISYIS